MDGIVSGVADFPGTTSRVENFPGSGPGTSLDPAQLHCILYWILIYNQGKWPIQDLGVILDPVYQGPLISSCI